MITPKVGEGLHVQGKTFWITAPHFLLATRMNTSISQLLTKHCLEDRLLILVGFQTSFAWGKVIERVSNRPRQHLDIGSLFFQDSSFGGNTWSWSIGQFISRAIDKGHKCMLIILVLSTASDISIWPNIDQSRVTQGKWLLFP